VRGVREEELVARSVDVDAERYGKGKGPGSGCVDRVERSQLLGTQRQERAGESVGTLRMPIVARTPDARVRRVHSQGTQMPEEGGR
jgi:hypothetical protein